MGEGKLKLITKEKKHPNIYMESQTYPQGGIFTRILHPGCSEVMQNHTNYAKPIYHTSYFGWSICFNSLGCGEVKKLYATLLIHIVNWIDFVWNTIEKLCILWTTKDFSFIFLLQNILTTGLYWKCAGSILHYPDGIIKH